MKNLDYRNLSSGSNQYLTCFHTLLFTRSCYRATLKRSGAMSISQTDSEKAHMQDRRRECRGGRAGTVVAGGALCSTDLLRVPEQELLHRPQPQGSHCSSEGKPRTETYMHRKRKCYLTRTTDKEDKTKKMKGKAWSDPYRKGGEKELDCFFLRRTELPGGARGSSRFYFWSPFNNLSPGSCWSAEHNFAFLKVFTCRSGFLNVFSIQHFWIF